MNQHDLPRHYDLMKSTLIALDNIGGSASLNEINDTVIELKKFSEEELGVEYESGNGYVIPDRLSWARSHLGQAGLLASGGRGIWLLTDEGRAAISLSDTAIRAKVNAAVRSFADARKKAKGSESIENSGELDLAIGDWLKAMDPAAFERLAQRLLRESGFVKVEVTGRSGDGGIDGTGIMQLSLMSFHVLFQCKRYQGSVGSGAVRDFRGAMMGRTDKGLIITTGTFSPDARREATRDGAPPIDLIDGEALCEKLKELSLGVETKLVEEVSVKPDWFDQI
jgi:restriction system protein